MKKKKKKKTSTNVIDLEQITRVSSLKFYLVLLIAKKKM